jgi:hypothetical protein
MDKIKNNIIPFLTTTTGGYTVLYFTKGTPFMTRSIFITGGLMSGYLLGTNYENQIENHVNEIYKNNETSINYVINQGILISRTIEKKIKDFIKS